MPTPWQDVYSVVWGVLILRVVDIWRVPTRTPLVTPLVLRVLEEKKKEKLRPRDGASWRRMYLSKAYARPSHSVAACIQQ
jgi:hypothetical protein